MEVIIITKNQIEFAKLQETKRSNLEQERATRLRDDRGYQTTLMSLGETARHNLATEQFQLASLDETSRHNRAQEAYNTSYLVELGRSNLAREQETARHNQAVEIETYRSNLARETETQRANLAQEGYRAMELSIRGQELEQTKVRDLNAYVLGSERNMLDRLKAEETQRANMVSESIRRDTNRIQEEQNQFSRYMSSRQQDEVERANLAREQFNLSSLSETIRSNQAREAYNWGALNEQVRANLASEQLRHEANVEAQRSNQASEALRAASNRTQALQVSHNYEVQMRNYEQSRLNASREVDLKQQQINLGYSQLDEARRHNIEEEFTKGQTTNQGWLTSFSRAAATWLPILGGAFIG